MDIEEIRKFNRYYSRILGIFDRKVFDLNYSMVEMRILGEIGRHPGVTAHSLTKHLGINKSYLSRILNKLEKDSFIFREKDMLDSRIQHLYLTSSGITLNDYVEEKSDLKVAELLESLSEEELKELTHSMSSIQNILCKVVSNQLEELK